MPGYPDFALTIVVEPYASKRGVCARYQLIDLDSYRGLIAEIEYIDGCAQVMAVGGPLLLATMNKFASVCDAHIRAAIPQAFTH